MKWPLMFRNTHEKYYNHTEALVKAQSEITAWQSAEIESLQNVIITLRTENKALTDSLTQQRVVNKPDKAEDKPKGTHIPNGRSGWRARSAILSDRTVPAPKDSARALEERVNREGGKV